MKREIEIHLGNISLPILLVLKFWNIPCKIFLLGQNGSPPLFFKPWMERDACIWMRAEKFPFLFRCRNPCFVGKDLPPSYQVFLVRFLPQTEEDRRASSSSSNHLFQQQASCGLIGPSTSRHSKWRADSYRIRKFSPFILDCIFQTKTGKCVPASLPQQFILTVVEQNM